MLSLDLTADKNWILCVEQLIFDSVAQLQRRELNSSGRYEILFGEYEGITFPSEEMPSIIGFSSKAFLMEREYILAIK